MAVLWLKSAGKALWVVVDGAYAKAPFLQPLIALGVIIVSRLRKDAALFGLPEPRRPGQRGRTRLYGEQRLDLAKRAGQRRGWQRGVFDLYGKPTAKKYKTFLATWRPAGGLIRVVLVQETRGWVAFFCTNPCQATFISPVQRQSFFPVHYVLVPSSTTIRFPGPAFSGSRSGDN